MAAAPQTLAQTDQRLRARRAELLVRRQRVDHDLARGNEPLVADSSDHAIQLHNDETQREIEAIDRALERMKLGLYGICKACGEQIPAARLRAMPHAVTCVDCPSG
jgi:DnaK suppressor protein